MRGNEGNGLDRELVESVEESGWSYEFGIREKWGDCLSSCVSYCGWGRWGWW